MWGILLAGLRLVWGDITCWTTFSVGDITCWTSVGGLVCGGVLLAGLRLVWGDITCWTTFRVGGYYLLEEGITCWTMFWDSFESAIDRNTGLSEIDKFNYLKSLLEKPAAEAISGLTLIRRQFTF